MGRRRIYESSAARKRAYRLRTRSVQKDRQEQGPGPTPPKKARPSSRPRRFESAVAEIEALHQEYDDWLQSMPESLRESHLAERLAETVDQLSEALDLLSQVDLPRGFGRD